MSLKNMLECIKNNDLECLKQIMEDSDTFLTNSVCTRLLIETFERNNIPMANYIIKYDFDLDGDLFDQYLDSNRPFSEKQIANLNRLLSRFYICCMVKD